MNRDPKADELLDIKLRDEVRREIAPLRAWRRCLRRGCHNFTRGEFCPLHPPKGGRP